MTHTYSRSLLEEVSDQAILDFLQSTILSLSSSETFQSSIAWRAVLARLESRIAFLETITEAAADTRDASAISPLWKKVIGTLPPIKESTSLGKPVPESFSVKLQRKLASTVPPRPIVQIGFETAFGILEQLCKDGEIVVEVLEYYGSHSLMVSQTSNLIILFIADLSLIDFCFIIPSTQTSTACLHTDCSSELFIW